MSSALTVVAIVLVGLLVWVAITYNGLVRLRTIVDESWGGIDVELSRRHDLIPNLVETVRGYAAHEREVLESLVRAREQATTHRDDRPRARVAYEEGVTAALGTVLARVEAYPELQASGHFLGLQRELTLTEDRIAAARRFYNGNVRLYNTRVRTVPNNVVAALLRFRARDFFELSDPATASAPGVDLA